MSSPVIVDGYPKIGAELAVQYYRILEVVRQQEEARSSSPRFRFFRRRPAQDATDYEWYAAHLRLHNALR